MTLELIWELNVVLKSINVIRYPLSLVGQDGGLQLPSPKFILHMFKILCFHSHIQFSTNQVTYQSLFNIANWWYHYYYLRYTSNNSIKFSKKCKLFSKDLDMIWEQILLKKRVSQLGGSNNQPSDFA